VKEAISALEKPEVFKGSGRYPGAYFNFTDVLKKRLEDVVNNSSVTKKKQLQKQNSFFHVQIY